MKKKILKQSEVRALLGISSVRLWRWQRKGLFPKSVQLGPRRVGWRSEDIDAWLESRQTVTDTK